MIESASEWPGASSFLALTTGLTEKGVWFNRTAEYRARLRGRKPLRYEHSIEYPLEHVPLPCWKGFSLEERLAHCRDILGVK